MSREKINLFSDKAMNALYQAILDNADELFPKEITSDNYHMYKWIEETPRSSMVAFIVDKLRENGFDIVEK